MDIETVINARMWDGFWDFFIHRFDVTVFWFLGTVFLHAFVLGIALGPPSEDYTENEVDKSVSLWSFIFVSIISSFLYFSSYENFAPKNWEEEYANPFMESLPYSIEEIDIISIKTHTTTEYYIEYAVEENGKMVNKNVIAPISKKLNKGDVPKLQFQYLEKSLIEEESEKPKYQKGRYNISLLVPRDFTFYQ